MIVLTLIFCFNLLKLVVAASSEVQAMPRGPIFKAIESAVDCYQVLKQVDEYAAEHADPESTISFDAYNVQYNCKIYPKIAHVNLT